MLHKTELLNKGSEVWRTEKSKKNLRKTLKTKQNERKKRKKSKKGFPTNAPLFSE